MGAGLLFCYSKCVPKPQSHPLPPRAGGSQPLLTPVYRRAKGDELRVYVKKVYMALVSGKPSPAQGRWWFLMTAIHLGEVDEVEQNCATVFPNPPILPCACLLLFSPSFLSSGGGCRIRTLLDKVGGPGEEHMVVTEDRSSLLPICVLHLQPSSSWSG